MSVSAGPVRLPKWYARFSTSAVREPVLDDDTVRLGPVTVFQSRQGVETATSGAPGDQTVVLFDGYLFERQSLSRELALPQGASDAQIAAAAFQRWRDDVFDRLDGSYLLAIWDPATGRLLLGHDALGHHPVFYASSSDAIWFGSNVLALAGSGHVSNRANRISLALATMTKWPAAGQTFFESIRRLHPGRYLTVTRDHGVREQRYFSPWLRDDEPDLSARQVDEQFEPALVGAVARCMELDPEGIMLSGGLDSVTIAALAAEYATGHGTPPIAAVSGRRDGEFTGEEPMQDATAAALGMRHLVVRQSEWMGERGEVELSLDVIPELPAPSRIYWVGATMAFYRHTAAQNVHVLLTGSGGDNWVGVGDAYAAENMRRLRLNELRRFVRSYTNTGGLSFSSAARHLLWSGGLRVLLDAAAARWMPGLKARYHKRRARVGLPEWLCADPRLKSELVETLYGQRPPSLTEQGRTPTSYYRHAQRAVVNPYYEYEFELGFHIETACGLRLLSPYHDRQLVRFLNAVPPDVLLEGARYKGLLRPVAQRRLPSLGLEHQRKDYAPGVLSAHRTSLREGVLKTWPRARFDRLAQLGVLDPTALGRAAQPSTRVVLEWVRRYAIMSTECWVGVHIEA